MRWLARRCGGVRRNCALHRHGDSGNDAAPGLRRQHTLDMRQPIHGVYYRNTAVSARIASFLDHLADGLGRRRSLGDACICHARIGAGQGRRRIGFAGARHDAVKMRSRNRSRMHVVQTRTPIT